MIQRILKKCNGCIEVGNCLGNMSCPEIINALKKLERYEELERQDRLIKLPCRVGSRVYIPMILENKIHLGIVRSFSYIVYNDFRAKISIGCENIYEKTSDFGRTVFLTYEDAKKVLDEARQV